MKSLAHPENIETFLLDNRAPDSLEIASFTASRNCALVLLLSSRTLLRYILEFAQVYSIPSPATSG
jgi:hypothetical protein